jgi:hypothetical protein
MGSKKEFSELKLRYAETKGKDVGGTKSELRAPIKRHASPTTDLAT